MNTRRAGFLAGLQPSGRRLPEGCPLSAIVPLAWGTNTQSQSDQIERATVHIFFFPLQVPKIGFRREVSKQLSKGEEYSLPLLGSDQARE